MFNIDFEQVKCEGSTSTAFATQMLSTAALGTAQASALHLTSATSAINLTPLAAVNTISLAVSTPTFSGSSANFAAFHESSHEEKER